MLDKTRASETDLKISISVLKHLLERFSYCKFCRNYSVYSLACRDEFGNFFTHEFKVGGNDSDTVFYILFHWCFVVRNNAHILPWNQIFEVTLVEKLSQRAVAN